MKKKIRKFLSDPIHKRFTLSKFQDKTGLGNVAEAILKALIEKSDEYKREQDATYKVCRFVKNTEYFCPSGNHDTLVLERRNNGEGWCYECEDTYELNADLIHEVVYTREWERDKPELEIATKTTWYKRIRRELRIHWQFVLGIMISLAIAIIGILFALYLHHNPLNPQNEYVLPPATLSIPATIRIHKSPAAITAIESPPPRPEATDTVPATPPRSDAMPAFTP